MLHPFPAPTPLLASHFPSPHTALATYAHTLLNPQIVMHSLDTGMVVVLIRVERLAKRLLEQGEVLVELVDLALDDLGGDLAEVNNVTFIANSVFTADRFARDNGILSQVIYPMVDRTRYSTSTTGENVTFINPHPHKGVDIALDVAQACPDIPFVFVRAWTLSEGDEAALLNRLRDLPNVSLINPTQNMKAIYGKCRIIFAPSRWEEAFGRIAAEAHISGIPVVGSSRGGLPEAIGPGGVMLDADAPVDQWVAAVQRLWHDKQHHADLSEAARLYAQREAMQQERQLAAIEQILSQAILRQDSRAYSFHNR